MAQTISLYPPFSRSPHSHSAESLSVPKQDANSLFNSSPIPQDKSQWPPLIVLQNVRLSSVAGLSDLTSIWLDPHTGKVVAAQDAFYANREDGRKVQEIDLDGSVVAPGYLELQINGAYGVDFSSLPTPAEGFQTIEEQDKEYIRRLETVANRITETGITSFVPTIISQTAENYHRLLPLLGPREFASGASVLGYHCEGPFLSPKKPGCHPQENLISLGSNKTFDDVYSKEGLSQKGIKMFTLAPEVEGILEGIRSLSERGATVCIGHSNANGVEAMGAVLEGARMVTHMYNAMPQLHHRDTGIIGLLGAPPSLPKSLFKPLTTRLLPDPIAILASRASSPEPRKPRKKSISLSSTRSQSRSASRNRISSSGLGTEDLLQRLQITQQEKKRKKSVNSSSGEETSDDATDPTSPKVVAVEGEEAVVDYMDDGDEEEEVKFQRPFYGIITDGIHVHPNAVRLAYQAHPAGCILVTDCVHVMDPNAKDGLYPFRDSTKILRKGSTITLEGTSTLAGSAVDMTTCIRNLSKFANISLSASIACATANPAKCLGGEVEKVKGHLRPGADADLCILDAKGRVTATWVRGKLVWAANSA